MLQLSEAMILGDPLKKCNPEEWISWDGSCGCALGGALLATGVTVEVWVREFLNHTPGANWFRSVPCIMSRWPWLTAEHLKVISAMYRQVAYGAKTIEDVAAYVRGVEPAEQSSTNILDAQEELTVA